jgi:hypothetical protein
VVEVGRARVAHTRGSRSPLFSSQSRTRNSTSSRAAAFDFSVRKEMDDSCPNRRLPRRRWDVSCYFVLVVISFGSPDIVRFSHFHILIGCPFYPPNSSSPPAATHRFTRWIIIVRHGNPERRCPLPIGALDISRSVYSARVERRSRGCSMACPSSTSHLRPFSRLRRSRSFTPTDFEPSHPEEKRAALHDTTVVVYSTVTLFAKLRGLSIGRPKFFAA